ncbi:helix-turn-helix domain-containing protein [Stackebrandtia endophytica]|nr:helix-turn-helix transcriptional regulator [Stackebrandtia endophytica]
MGTTEVRGPTLAKWRLGREMQKLREDAGLSPAEAGALIGVVRQTISRMERGAVAVRSERIETLCNRYGASTETISALTAMAVRVNERGWWERYKGGVRQAFRMYAESEPEARSIDTYEPEFLPGLVQTPEYTRQLHIDPRDDADLIVGARVNRQKRVFRSDGPRMRILIGSGAMRLLGDLPPEVRIEQAARLREINRYEQVDIGIGTRLTAALGVPFALARFEDDFAFVYMDALDGCRYESAPDILSNYQASFERAWGSATPVERFVDEQEWLA